MEQRAKSALEALARVPLPVAVIASAHGVERGCSTGTLSYLSLDPPLLVIALGPGSATLSLVRRSSEFSVSVLSEEQGDVAVRAARKGREQDKFAEIGIPAATPPDGLVAPAVEGSVAVMWCRLVHEGAHGDHVLCVGRIVASEAAADLAPLLRFGRRYHRLGVPLDVHGERHEPL